MKLGRTSPKSTKSGESIRITQTKQYELITVFIYAFKLVAVLVCSGSFEVEGREGLECWTTTLGGQPHCLLPTGTTGFASDKQHMKNTNQRHLTAP
jgi:hypothetical protein